MKKYILVLLSLVLLTITSCNYLNMVPEEDIDTIESIFERKANAENWWCALYGRFYSRLVNHKNNTAYIGADEFIAGQSLYNLSSSHRIDGLYVASGRQMSQAPYGECWTLMYRIIRDANTFLANIHRVYNMTEEERRWWTADVKAFKALVYFELMRRYGPICIIPDNLPVDLEISEYQLARQPIDVCVKEIIALLDEAEPYIPLDSERPEFFGFTICKEALYAIKAKVLLYAASPLFNGNMYYSDFKNKNGEHLFNPDYDHNKWLLAAEAADKAIEICKQAGRKLTAGSGSKKTKLLNTMKDIESSTFSRFNNSEFLLEAKYNTSFVSFTLPRLEDDNYHFAQSSLGNLSPSMTMVEKYYTSNGLPIDYDITWNPSSKYKMGRESSLQYEGVVPLNTDVINLHLRREPRFYASIAGDRMYYQRGISRLDRDNNLLVEARKYESPWGTKEDIIVGNRPQNITGYWVKKLIHSDLETSTYMTSFPKDASVAIIRLAEVYLMQAEAWNEYEGPSEKVYSAIDKVRIRAGILPVREAWKTYSTFGDKVDTKEGMRDIIMDEYTIELAYEGHRYWNIRRWLIADQVMNEKQYCWNVLGTTAEAFYNGFEGPGYEVDNFKFVGPRDYLDPIKAEEILISGMKQNPGWVK